MMIPVQICEQLFHILALRIAVNRARIFDDRKLILLHKPFYLRLLDKNQGADQSQTGPVEMCDRRKGINSPFHNQ